MAWASTGWVGLPPRSSAVAAVSRAFSPAAVTRNPPSRGSTVRVPPRGMAPPPTMSMLSRSLARFLGTNSRGRFQTIVVLPSSMRPRAAFSASPSSICAPAELQLGRSLLRAFLNQIEREGLGLFVLVLFQDFQSVDDGADRTDQVVAN